MFIIKRGNRVLKRSYDSYNGMWSWAPSQAKKWKTRKGVQAFFDRYVSIWRITGGVPEIVELTDD